MIEQLKYRLVNRETREIIGLDFTEKEELIIGRSTNEADIQFNDMTISRKHCAISLRDSCVFIKDLNSTNKTSVDGIVLQPYVEMKLHVFSAIRLAGIVLIFQTNTEEERQA